MNILIKVEDNHAIYLFSEDGENHLRRVGDDANKPLRIKSVDGPKLIVKKILVTSKHPGRKKRELEGINRELNSFSYVSSHDLQEPLRKIQTFTSRILEKEEKNLSESGKDYFQRMQQAANRMQHIIDDLVTLARVNAKKKEKKKTLNKIIEEVKEELKGDLLGKSIEWQTVNVTSGEIIPEQFQQLLCQLVSNCVKFSYPGRDLKIVIRCEIIKGSKLKNKLPVSQKKYCHISVEDNGIGFEQKFNDKIFEVFQRLHAKDEYEGTGIGLAICKKITENHKGIIEAEGTPGKGATFHIYFPLS